MLLFGDGVLFGLPFTAPGRTGVGSLGAAAGTVLELPGSGLTPGVALGVLGVDEGSLTSLGTYVADMVVALVPNPPVMGCGVPVSKRSFTLSVR